MYQCFECSEKFLTSEQLQKHLDIHDEINDIEAKYRKKKKKLPIIKNIKPEFKKCDEGRISSDSQSNTEKTESNSVNSAAK